MARIDLAFHLGTISMLKSMTGFGRCEVSEGERKITVEMKSVNHRYLDVTLKMPKKLNFFESAIRALLKEYIQRGKVDVFITYEDLSHKSAALSYNPAIAAQYMEYFRQMEEEFGLKNDIGVSDLAKCPEVLTLEEQQENEEEVRELLSDSQMDEGRIATEVTIFADKICVDEETVRLKSHIEAMKTALIAGGSIGRKLDFIAQEMNREANTTLSKANDLKISDCAIDLKTDIEKVREQIQNLE